jgi:hypothetical protein
VPFINYTESFSISEAIQLAYVLEKDLQALTIQQVWLEGQNQELYF